MKSKKRFLCGVMLLTTSGALLSFVSPVSGNTKAPQIMVRADSGNKKSSSTINEAWGKPEFAYGSGLNQQQLQNTLDIFGVTADEVSLIKTTGADLIKYLGYGSGDDSIMFSTVMVSKQDKSKGAHVEILTPQQIQYTATDYYNPIITSGVTDKMGLDIKIGVAKGLNVSGESALTGLYKSLEKNGEKIDLARAELAQEELTTTNDVANNIAENAAKEDQDATREDAHEAYKTLLNQALVEIKQALAEIKEKQNKLATKEDIEKIVNDALANNNLNKYVTNIDIEKLVALGQGYQKTDGVLSKESMAQLEDLSKSFKNSLDKLSGELGALGDKISDSLKENEGFFANLWESIRNFFLEIGDWVSNLIENKNE